jgi:hypothetical protein
MDDGYTLDLMTEAGQFLDEIEDNLDRASICMDLLVTVYGHAEVMSALSTLDELPGSSPR